MEMQSTESCIVYLGVNYHTTFGENVVVLGNIPELGNWDIQQGFKLNYHEDYNWTNALKLERSSKIIEYKYVVYNQITNQIQWEEGDNRVLDLSLLKNKKSEIYNVEVWNHREICIRIKYDCEKYETLAICGEGAGLGNWKNPLRMHQVIKKDPLTGQRTTFWQKSFAIKPETKRIKYRFVLINEKEDQFTWERDPSRVCDLITLTILSPYKKYETFPNKKDCIKFVLKNNRYIKYDCNFVSEFIFNEITDNVIIGPYPQNLEEIEKLSKQGVKAVFNLQTRHDMKYRTVDWDLIREYYHKTRIKAINFPIIDACPEDLYQKAYDAASFLDELIKKYGKVYVHCTSGIWRAPHVTAAYLMFYKGHEIDQVIKLLKEKRHTIYINRDVLWRAYHSFIKKHKSLVERPHGVSNLTKNAHDN